MDIHIYIYIYIYLFIYLLLVTDIYTYIKCVFMFHVVRKIFVYKYHSYYFNRMVDYGFNDIHK